MRLLEGLMLVALIPLVVGLFLAHNRRSRWRIPLAAIPIAIGLAHLFIEGYRWPMVPAYTLAALFLVVALAGRAQQAV